jgi:hypothetical protein
LKVSLSAMAKVPAPLVSFVRLPGLVKLQPFAPTFFTLQPCGAVGALNASLSWLTATQAGVAARTLLALGVTPAPLTALTR